MKIAKDWEEAHNLINDLWAAARGQFFDPKIGIDIGKQFGTRIIMHIDPSNAHKLLNELEKRDLDLPSVIQMNPTTILIGAEPE